MMGEFKEFEGKIIESISKTEEGELIIYFTDGSHAGIYPSNDNVIDLDGYNDLIIEYRGK